MTQDFDPNSVPAKHILLPYCWVCERTFCHDLQPEDHHIIPRAYGGVDGPQVRLCSDHHTALHEIGKRLYSGKPFNEFLSGRPEPDKKLVYLGTIACNARLATENDPNKALMVVLKFNQKHKRMLEDLKRVLQARSRSKVVEAALESLHSKFFLKR